MKKTLIKQKDIKNGDVPMVSIRWFEDESSKEKTVVIDYFHNNGEVLSSTSFEWTKDEIKELMELL